MRPLVLICDDDKLACAAIAKELGEKDLATAMDTSGLGYEMTKMLRPAAVVLASSGSHRMWVLRRLKADPATASVPVVLYVASDTPESELEARRLGISVYVRKPDPRLGQVVSEVARQHGASVPRGVRAISSRGR